MTDLTNTNEQPKPYTDAWWWSADGGQRVARIMMEMMPHNDNTKAHYSHDFLVAVAKKAMEAGYARGVEDGYTDGYSDARSEHGSDSLFPDSCY